MRWVRKETIIYPLLFQERANFGNDQTTSNWIAQEVSKQIAPLKTEVDKMKVDIVSQAKALEKVEADVTVIKTSQPQIL